MWPCVEGGSWPCRPGLFAAHWWQKAQTGGKRRPQDVWRRKAGDDDDWCKSWSEADLSPDSRICNSKVHNDPHTHESDTMKKKKERKTFVCIIGSKRRDAYITKSFCLTLANFILAVAFSLRARIFWECLTIHPLPAHFFLKWRLACAN